MFLCEKPVDLVLARGIFNFAEAIGGFNRLATGPTMI
jgi:hypothetical protein